MKPILFKKLMDILLNYNVMNRDFSMDSRRYDADTISYNKSNTNDFIRKTSNVKKFVNEMKNTLTVDIDKALSLIKIKLSDNSQKYNLIIQITAKYNLIKNSSLNGTYSQEEYQKFHAQIVKATLELLDALSEEDIIENKTSHPKTRRINP